MKLKVQSIEIEGDSPEAMAEAMKLVGGIIAAVLGGDQPAGTADLLMVKAKSKRQPKAAKG